MFDQKEIDAYRQVKAPAEFNISAKANIARRNRAKAAVAAAMFALVLSAGLWPAPDSFTVAMGDDTLQSGESLVLHGSAKTALYSENTFFAAIELKLPKEAAITVTEGSVMCEGNGPDTSLTLQKGQYTLQWMPSGKQSTLEIVCGDKVKRLALTQDEAETYLLSCK